MCETASNMRYYLAESVFQFAVVGPIWGVIEQRRLTSCQFERWFIDAM